MNKNKLKKQLDKYYHAHGQTLIVDTWEMIQNSEQDCCFDVYLADSDIGLFTIQNYNGLMDLDVVSKSYFREPKAKVIEVWDGVKASCIPLYMDGIITLKTFTPITKEDIIHATDYFVHEILDMMLFNIKFNDEVKE
jgi:hypothetical protein